MGYHEQFLVEECSGRGCSGLLWPVALDPPPVPRRWLLIHKWPCVPFLPCLDLSLELEDLSCQSEDCQELVVMGSPSQWWMSHPWWSNSELYFAWIQKVPRGIESQLWQGDPLNNAFTFVLIILFLFHFTISLGFAHIRSIFKSVSWCSLNPGWW